MRVLITGAAGFIGFHTANKFFQQGWLVHGIDNFNDYYDPSLKHARAAKLRESGVDIQHVDITDKDKLTQHLKNLGKIDLIIHLAAYAGVRYSLTNPYPYHKNNIEGTQNIIDVCESQEIENVIYASTSCVMSGHPTPWKEHEIFHKPISPYGYSKIVNESQFKISSISNAVGLRFFTVYGPWGRPDMALFDFTKNIIKGQPITLYNYGDMKRDFTYIEDIVQGIWLVSQNMTPRDIYCIGNGDCVSLDRFVQAIQHSLEIKATIEYGPMHPADVQETWSDTTKIQTIGYKSSTPIEVGVHNFVQWYKNYYGDC
jgi:UDP-glucuronate 4-epimerase